MSTTSTPEGQFRDELSGEMSGYWLMTWHEDREINPGVPDISYVMNGYDCETGWLELKAVRPGNRVSVKIEQSQHMWISLHCERVPVHFAIKVDKLVYIVEGKKHRELAAVKTVQELYDMSVLVVVNIRAQLPKLLKSFTSRGRHVSSVQRHQTSTSGQSST